MISKERETDDSEVTIVDEQPSTGTHRRGHGLHMTICVVVMAGVMWFLHQRGGFSGYWLIFLVACPLMHLFMGHGTHGRDTSRRQR